MTDQAGATQQPTNISETVSAFDELQAMAGLELPSDFQELYQKHLAYLTEAATFCVEDASYFLRQVLPISAGLEGIVSTYRWLVKEGDTFGMSCLPFAEDDQSNFFLYSLESNSFGQIFYSRFVDELQFKTQVVQLADNLQSFIKGLGQAVRDLV